MNARKALDTAREAMGARLHRFQDFCGPRGFCQRESLENDPGRWTWCPDCLTVYDDFGTPVNEIEEFDSKH